MKFRIDAEKFRSAVKSKRGRMAYSYAANQIGISQRALLNIECGQNKQILATTYASICHWLGVSLYHFLIEVES